MAQSNSQSKTIQNQVQRVVVAASTLLAVQDPRNTARTQTQSYANQIVDVVGTLSEILQVQGIAGAYSVHARPVDVYGCNAEYKPGQGWLGCLAVFGSQAEFDGYVPQITNLASGAWVFVVNASTGSSMKVLQ